MFDKSKINKMDLFIYTQRLSRKIAHAKKNKLETFIFDNAPMDVNFAKYLLEYLKS